MDITILANKVADQIHNTDADEMGLIEAAAIENNVDLRDLYDYTRHSYHRRHIQGKVNKADGVDPRALVNTNVR